MRITIEQSGEATLLTLEGRVAGPWAAELQRVWVERAPRLTHGPLAIDVSNVTYADADGIQILREIYSRTGAEFVASTPWTRHLAAQAAANSHQGAGREQGHAGNE